MITPQKINKNAAQIKSELLSNKKVGPYHHMVFAVGEMAAHSKPGNFVAISVGGEQSALILRRAFAVYRACLLYTSPSPRDRQKSRMPSSA